MQTTDKGAAARAKSEAARAQKKASLAYRKSIVKDATEKGIKFIHMPEARMTIAYRTGGYGRDTVEVTTALAHPKDDFCKEYGRYVAANNLREAQSIFLRVPRGAVLSEWLRMVFWGQALAVGGVMPPRGVVSALEE